MAVFIPKTKEVTTTADVLENVIIPKLKDMGYDITKPPFNQLSLIVEKLREDNERFHESEKIYKKRKTEMDHVLSQQAWWSRE